VIKENNIYKIGLPVMVLCAFVLAGCNMPTSSSQVDLSKECKVLSKSVREIFPDEFPDYLLEGEINRNGEFDPNQFFVILNKLSMTKGETLDFVYEHNSGNGLPILYARSIDQNPVERTEQLPENYQGIEYLSHLNVKDQKDGYLQYALLSALGGQFYLFGHGNYQHYDVVCDSRDLEEIVVKISTNEKMMMLSSDDQSKARNIDPAPVIKVGDDKVEVEILLFSMWKGFIRQTYIIDRKSPNRLLDLNEEIIVPYNCGIFF
jgi:hypothetical protein